MKPETRNRINTIIGLIALLVAIVFLSRRLREIEFSELAAHLKSIGGVRLSLVLLGTVLGYWILTCYDWLALRFLGKGIAYSRVVFAAFVGYSISKNLGLSWLTGGSLRYRFYSRFGMTLVDVSKLLLFNTSIFLLGFFFWGGFSFLFFPGAAEGTFLPERLFPMLGLLFWLLPFLYLFICHRCREIRFRGRRWPLPPLSIGLFQIFLGTVDVFVTLSILYLILPPGAVSLGTFIAAYFMAQVVAITTHVPGGLGVFESIMLVLLGGRLSEAALLSSLLLYRVIYFLIPMVIGIALLAIDEIRDRPGRSLGAILHQKSGKR